MDMKTSAPGTSLMSFINPLSVENHNFDGMELVLPQLGFAQLPLSFDGLETFGAHKAELSCHCAAQINWLQLGFSLATARVLI